MSKRVGNRFSFIVRYSLPSITLFTILAVLSASTALAASPHLKAQSHENAVLKVTPAGSKPLPIPNYISVQCLYITINAYAPAPGNNYIDVFDEVDNTCNFTVTGTLQMYAQVTNCVPYPEQYNSFSFSIYANDVYDDPTVYYEAGCVVCNNGVPVAYPPFNVRISAQAYGTGGGGKYRSSSNTPSTNVGLTNNPPSYEPPCP